MAVFAAIAVAGDRGAGCALEKLALSSELRFSRLYRGGVDADIVVLGNSRAADCCPAPAMARATGRSVFSLAYNGASAEIAEALFFDYLESNRAPRVVLVELAFLDSGPLLLRDLKLYAERSERLRRLIRERAPSIARGARVSRLFAVNSELLLRSLLYLRRDDQSYTNRRRISAAALAALENAPAEPLRIRPENLHALRRIIAAGAERGIDVRLFVSPYLPQTRDRMQIDRWQTAVAAALPDSQIWSFADALADPALFADRIHVNERGAAALLEIMVERGLLE